MIFYLSNQLLVSESCVCVCVCVLCVTNTCVFGQLFRPSGLLIGQQHVTLCKIRRLFKVLFVVCLRSNRFNENPFQPAAIFLPCDKFIELSSPFAQLAMLAALRCSVCCAVAVVFAVFACGGGVLLFCLVFAVAHNNNDNNKTNKSAKSKQEAQQEQQEVTTKSRHLICFIHILWFFSPHSFPFSTIRFQLLFRLRCLF